MLPGCAHERLAGPAHDAGEAVLLRLGRKRSPSFPAQRTSYEKVLWTTRGAHIPGTCNVRMLHGGVVRVLGILGVRGRRQKSWRVEDTGLVIRDSVYLFTVLLEVVHELLKLLLEPWGRLGWGAFAPRARPPRSQ